jgi:hypothetical protein
LPPRKNPGSSRMEPEQIWTIWLAEKPLVLIAGIQTHNCPCHSLLTTDYIIPAFPNCISPVCNCYRTVRWQPPTPPPQKEGKIYV